MTKPRNTLVDRPAYRDWSIWLACAFMAVPRLWDVVDIYLFDRRIYRMLGLQGSVMTLLAELLLAAMTGTFIVVVLTTSRRAIRNWRYQRYLVRNVIIMTSTGGERRPLQHQTPNGAPTSFQRHGEPSGAFEGLTSPRHEPALARSHFNHETSEAPTAVEESPYHRG